MTTRPIDVEAVKALAKLLDFQLLDWQMVAIEAISRGHGFTVARARVSELLDFQQLTRELNRLGML